MLTPSLVCNEPASILTDSSAAFNHADYTTFPSQPSASSWASGGPMHPIPHSVHTQALLAPPDNIQVANSGYANEYRAHTWPPFSTSTHHQPASALTYYAYHQLAQVPQCNGQPPLPVQPGPVRAQTLPATPTTYGAQSLFDERSASTPSRSSSSSSGSSGSSDDNNTVPVPKSRYFCTYCCERNSQPLHFFNKKASWKKHLNDYHETFQELKCRVAACGEYFGRHSHRVKHYRTYHRDERVPDESDHDTLSEPCHFGCGFADCKVVLSQWNRYCDHVFDHMDSREDLQCHKWSYTQRIRNLLRQDGAFNDALTKRINQNRDRFGQKPKLRWNRLESRELELTLARRPELEPVESLVSWAFDLGVSKGTITNVHPKLPAFHSIDLHKSANFTHRSHDSAAFYIAHDTWQTDDDQVPDYSATPSTTICDSGMGEMSAVPTPVIGSCSYGVTTSPYENPPPDMYRYPSTSTLPDHYTTPLTPQAASARISAMRYAPLTHRYFPQSRFSCDTGTSVPESTPDVADPSWAASGYLLYQT